MMATSRTTSIKKMNLYFTYESRDCLKRGIYFVYHYQNYRKTKFRIQRKISRRGYYTFSKQRKI